MSLPYVYMPRPGEWVRVSRVETLGGCLIGTYEEDCGHATSTRVLPEDVPAVARQIAEAMHEAAGLPAPVILERPGATVKDGVNRAGPIEVGRLGDRVTVGLYGIQPEEIEPAVARRLAALIAIRADEVQSDEPDPAEVQELAAEIRSELKRMGGSPPEATGMAARIALRWMRDKQQRGEVS